MSISSHPYSELWVCFEPPDIEIPPNILLLSFMSPESEIKYEGVLGTRFINGRKVVQGIRRQAREAYVNLIAEMASTPCIFGKTLRQAMKGKDGISRWWYLRASSKDSVNVDSPYTPILRLYSIKTIAEQRNINHIRLFGAKRSFSLCLRKSFNVYLQRHECRQKLNIRSFLRRFPVFYGLAVRIVFTVTELYKLIILKSIPSLSNNRLDVAFQGFWDWSFTGKTNFKLRNIYFSDLPERLRKMGYSVGWFCYLEKFKKRTSYKKLVCETEKFSEIILIERYLKTADVLRAAFQFKYVLIVLAFLLSGKFRLLFIKDGLNLYPLFRNQIIWSIFGKDILLNELICIAVRNACRDIKPKIILTFQELFLACRPIYAGARQGKYPLKVFAAQHAAYCTDKTLGTLVKDIELNGTPDDCNIPVPDGIFVMGELSQSIFHKNGFPDERVIISGGLRYQHVKIANNVSRKNSTISLSILLISSMNEYLDIDMCKAVCAATKEMPFVHLRIREHPFYRISHLEGFERFRSRIEVSTNTQQEDLAGTDLIIFTYSSFADEAILMGIPIWQWLWAGFNASVFLDIPIIPVFGSVNELRESIRKFMDNPDPYYPTEETKRKVLKECFGPAPEMASEIISNEIVKEMKVQ